MGLDSWLWVRQRISAHQPQQEESFEAVCELMGTTPLAVQEFSHTYMGFVVLEVAYWRNAHFIHAWLEDCLRYELPNNVWSPPLRRSELEHLYTVCQRISQDPTLAEQLLPPTLHYNVAQHYPQLQATLPMLEFILGQSTWANEAVYEFVYQCAWS